MAWGKRAISNDLRESLETQRDDKIIDRVEKEMTSPPRACSFCKTRLSEKEGCWRCLPGKVQGDGRTGR